eukprot:4792449-Prymnesium_polylepis.1
MERADVRVGSVISMDNSTCDRLAPAFPASQAEHACVAPYVGSVLASSVPMSGSAQMLSGVSSFSGHCGCFGSSSKAIACCSATLTSSSCLIHCHSSGRADKNGPTC